MSRFLALYRGTVGKKAIVAVTGAMMLGFLVLHVAGNLKVFLPDPEPGVPDIDVYSRFLRTMGEPLFPYAGVLWIVRVVMLIALGLHVVSVIQLAAHNRGARPVRYQRHRRVAASPAARAMLYTGVLLLAFVVVHVLHFTTGTIDAARFVEGAVYANLYRAFHVRGWVALYVGAMGLLALHLYHGAWSMFQSLGLDNPDRNRGLRVFAVVMAIGLFVAFSSLPIAFVAGALPSPPARHAGTPPAEAG